MKKLLKRVERLEEISSVHERLKTVECSLVENQQWKKWWQSRLNISVFVALLTIIPPLTVGIKELVIGWSEIKLEKEKIGHSITTDYLDRALDSERTLKSQIQVFRFLVEALDGKPIQKWAKNELDILETSSDGIAKKDEEITIVESEDEKLKSDIALLKKDRKAMNNEDNYIEIENNQNMLLRSESKRMQSISDRRKLEEQRAELESKLQSKSIKLAGLVKKNIRKHTTSIKSSSIFSEFLGFKIDDSKDKVVEKLGPPDKSKDVGNGWRNYYYDFGLRIATKGDIIKVISISSKKAIEKLKQKGIYDPKLNYYGNKKDEIFNTFGEPSETDSDYYVYTYDGGEVTFECYDFDNYACNEIGIQWY